MTLILGVCIGKNLQIRYISRYRASNTIYCNILRYWEQNDRFFLYIYNLFVRLITVCGFKFLRYKKNAKSMQHTLSRMKTKKYIWQQTYLIYVVWCQSYIWFSCSWNPRVACLSDSLCWAEGVQHRDLSSMYNLGEQRRLYVSWRAPMLPSYSWKPPFSTTDSGRMSLNVKQSTDRVILFARTELAGSLEKCNSSIFRCAASTLLSLLFACCTVAPSWFLVTCALKFFRVPRVLNCSHTNFVKLHLTYPSPSFPPLSKTQNIATH